MIWLTWRQHRKQLLFALLALAVVALVMVPTGQSMHHDFVLSGLAACIAKAGSARLSADGNCSQLSEQFASHYNGLTFIGVLFVILPVLFGIFFGAPLVAREVEQGTHRFVWTQSVSRMRWALTKFGLIGLATLALAVIYAYGVTWWSSPLVRNGGGRLNYVSFDVQGVVPIAYTLFAVALGICLGVLCRKVLPAMGFTLAGFVLVRVGIEWGARKHYLSPLTSKTPITSTLMFNQYAGDWVYASAVRNSKGETVLANGMIQCGGGTPAGDGGARTAVDAAAPCVGPGGPAGLDAGSYNWQLYQPGSRFWEFQAIESGIFLGLAALLVYFALVRLRRIA